MFNSDYEIQRIKNIRYISFCIDFEVFKVKVFFRFLDIINFLLYKKKY